MTGLRKNAKSTPCFIIQGSLNKTHSAYELPVSLPSTRFQNSDCRNFRDLYSLLHITVRRMTECKNPVHPYQQFSYNLGHGSFKVCIRWVAGHHCLLLNFIHFADKLVADMNYKKKKCTALSNQSVQPWIVNLSSVVREQIKTLNGLFFRADLSG